MKISGKLSYDNIRTLSLEHTFLEKTQGEVGGQIPPPPPPPSQSF